MEPVDVHPDRTDAEPGHAEILAGLHGDELGDGEFYRCGRRGRALASRSDFVTVTKAGDSDWFQLKPAVLAAIMEHFTAGLPVITGSEESAPTSEVEDDEIVSAIKELLETRVRPAVAQDGGDIIFEDFEDGIVYLHMQGSCSGCPSSTATLKAGIENMLRHYIPEVVEVRAV